jgi:hypothetical protein
MIRFLRLAACAAALAFLMTAPPANAAPRLSKADKAWIATWIADRKATKAKPAALRKYCACMHEVVEDNRPFGITELERAYPPVHQQCWDQYRR